MIGLQRSHLPIELLSVAKTGDPYPIGLVVINVVPVIEGFVDVPGWFALQVGVPIRLP